MGNRSSQSKIPLLSDDVLLPQNNTGQPAFAMLYVKHVRKYAERELYDFREHSLCIIRNIFSKEEPIVDGYQFTIKLSPMYNDITIVEENIVELISKVIEKILGFPCYIETINHKKNAFDKEFNSEYFDKDSRYVMNVYEVNSETLEMRKKQGLLKFYETRIYQKSTDNCSYLIVTVGKHVEDNTNNILYKSVLPLDNNNSPYFWEVVCVVCLSCIPTFRSSACLHVCLCRECTKKMADRKVQCPLCLVDAKRYLNVISQEEIKFIV